jgi:hypothetical protein
VSLREPVRRRLRVGCGVAFAAGAVMVSSGLLLNHAADARPPARVLDGTAVALPEPGAFGGRVGVYGVPASAQWPTPEELGCTLVGAKPGARLAPRVDDVSGPASMDRRVISTVALAPLLELVPSDAGGSLECSRASSVGPVYVVATSGVQDLAPMAAFSLASLALVVGGAGLLMLRPEER